MADTTLLSSDSNVSDDQFRLTVAPGTLIYDRDTDTFWQEPGGFFLMDRLVGWTRDHCPRPEGSDQSRTAGLAAWGLGGLAIGALAAGFRSRRSARAVGDDRPKI